GSLLGSEVLGYYTRAQSSVFSIVKASASVINPVFYSIVSQSGNQQKFQQNAFFRSYEVLIIVMPYLAGVLLFFSDDVISLLFGSSWLESANILQVFGIALLFRPLSKINVEMIKALGSIRSLVLIWGFALLFFVCLAIFLGSQLGAPGVAIAYVITSVMIFFSSTKKCLNILKINAYIFLKRLSLAYLRAIIVITALGLLKWWGFAANDVDFGYLANLVIISLVCVALYLTTSIILRVEADDDYLRFFGLTEERFPVLRILKKFGGTNV
ncbi:oligosaccharide flippase family protein, partial [Alphaproteobacteria bacterium]|nr:oligosaccharide flippase family protein [Alphaproteobacteria bacterium]